MGSCCSGDTPQPPDPRITAGAQTASNVSTALANAHLNNINQVTPLGSLTYTTDPANNYTFTDPSTGANYTIPQYTSTQKLSGPQQAIQDTNQASQLNLANLAKNQSGMLGQFLNTPFSPNANTPAAGDPNSLSQIPGAATSFGDAGPLQTTLADAGDITRDYGPADDFSADRGRVEQALYGRLNPQLDRERTNIEQRLADQGIRYGSQAYTAAMDDYNRQANDLRLGVTQTAGAEQARLVDMAAKRAGFQNAAQQQAYQEGLTSGQFTNAAQQNAFIQAAQRGTFGNAGLAQQLAQQQAQISAQNQARTQSLTEQYALRQEPINEVTSLLSGSQVKQPVFQQEQKNTIPTTDIAGLLNTNFNQNLDIYKTQSAANNALLGGVLGLGGNIALAKSDRRIKKNIHKLGTVFAADPEGDSHELPIYRYSFKADPQSTPHVGPMAQDVEKIIPAAVAEIGGIKHLDKRHVMGSIMRAA